MGSPQRVDQLFRLNSPSEVTLQVDDQGNETWTESGPSQQSGTTRMLKLTMAEIAYTKIVSTEVTITKITPGNRRGPNSNNSQQNQG